MKDVAHAEASPTPWKRRFFTLWGGQVFSLIGSALVQWALMFYLAVTTGSPIVLAIAGIMGLLPQVLLAPIAGAYIDRIDRKRVIIFADLLTALSTFLLVLLFLLGAADLLPIFLVMFFRSCMQAFHWPAMQAATSMMVPPEHLARVGRYEPGVDGPLHDPRTGAGRGALCGPPHGGGAADRYRDRRTGDRRGPGY